MASDIQKDEVQEEDEAIVQPYHKLGCESHQKDTSEVVEGERQLLVESTQERDDT